MSAFGTQNVLILTHDPSTLPVDTSVLQYREFDKKDAYREIHSIVAKWLGEIRKLNE